MKRVRLEPAWLLSLRPYRETSALVEAYTETHGRVGLVARGARGARSKIRGLLQPFQRLLLSWTDAGELGSLTGVEADGPPLLLQGEAVFGGWYLNELMLRLLARRDPHPGLFAPYASTLRQLAAAPGAEAPALRRFELQLLGELGYGLSLPDELQPDAWYRYDSGGSLLAAEPAPEHYRGASLIALASDRLETAEHLGDARRLLRAALEPHLGGKALRTPQLLRSLRSTVGRRGARA